jgi:hypothetical protein
MWRLKSSAAKTHLMLAVAFPELCTELRLLLGQKGEEVLVRQVPQLKIVERCRCGDDFCATIYTRPKPWGPTLRSIDLSPVRGMIILDVVDGQIASVEILYRDEIRKTLLKMLP